MIKSHLDSNQKTDAKRFEASQVHSQREQDAAKGSNQPEQVQQASSPKQAEKADRPDLQDDGGRQNPQGAQEAPKPQQEAPHSIERVKKAAAKELEKVLARLEDSEKAGEEAAPSDRQLLTLLADLLALIEEAKTSSETGIEGEVQAEKIDVDLTTKLDLTDGALARLVDLLAALAAGDDQEQRPLAVTLALEDGSTLEIPLSDLKLTLSTEQGGEETASLADLEKLVALLQKAEAAGEEKASAKLTMSISRESAQDARILVDAQTQDASLNNLQGIQLDATPSEPEAAEAPVQRQSSIAAQTAAAAAQSRTALQNLVARLNSGSDAPKTAVENSGPGPATLAASSEEGGNLVNRLALALNMQSVEVGSGEKPQVASPVAGSVPDISAELLQRLDLESLADSLASEKDEASRANLAERLARALERQGILLAKNVQQQVAASNIADSLIAKAEPEEDALPRLDSQQAQDQSRTLDGHKADKAAQDTLQAPKQAQQQSAQAPHFAAAQADKAETIETPRISRQIGAQNHIVNQVVERVAVSFQNGNEGEIRMTLKPESLGEMRIKISVEHDAVVAKIVVESQQVKGVIESNLNQLKDALEERGIAIGGFQVSTSEEHNAQTNDQDTPYGRTLGIPQDLEEEEAEQGGVQADSLIPGEGIYTRVPAQAVNAYRHVNYLA